MSNLSLGTNFKGPASWFLLSALLVFSCGGAGDGSSKTGELGSVPRPSETTGNARGGSPDDLAAQLTAAYDGQSCSTFIELFPTTFQSFIGLYGFDDLEGARPLYDKYEQHVAYFLSCPGISDTERLTKLIEIGVGGKWEADAASLIQENAKRLILKSPKEAIVILEKMGDGRAASFWRFLFDGPHPDDKKIKDQVNSIRKELGPQSNQSILLEAEYKKLKRDAKNH